MPMYASEQAVYVCLLVILPRQLFECVAVSSGLMERVCETMELGSMPTAGLLYAMLVVSCLTTTSAVFNTFRN